jgi:hypothetical protein
MYEAHKDEFGGLTGFTKKVTNEIKFYTEE